MHMSTRYKATRSRCGPARVSQAALLMLVLQACQAVTAQTSSTDVQALTAIKSFLYPPSTSEDVLGPHNWTTIRDPCGAALCGVSVCRPQFSSALYAETRCNWSGICCNNWYVTGISLPPQQSQTRPTLSMFPDAISNMEHLKVLKMAKQG